MKPRGRIGSLTAAATDLAGAVRRARESRRVRVRCYDEGGVVTLLDESVEPGLGLLEAAEALLDIVGAAPEEEPGDGPDDPPM